MISAERIHVPSVTDWAGLFRFDDDWRRASGKGVSVAIIDSGIDVLHPDLAGKVASSVEARIENKKVVFDPSDDGDSAGHGTACAGIIAKIAPDAELHSIKVLGAGGLGDGLARLAGRWTEEELERFSADIAPFERVDEELWR